MASKLQSVVLRAPGIYGLNFEGEAVQKIPEYAKLADNVAYDASGRLCNRKGFSPTNAKEATTLGSNPITVPVSGHTDALDTDGIADEQIPSLEFTLISGSLPPSAPRFLSVSNTAKTFATTDVSTGADTITISSHGLATTSSITYNDAGSTTLAGLVDGATYFAVKVDANTIKVASTAALATAGTTIDLTGAGNNSQYFTDGDKTVTITGTDVLGTGLEETITLTLTAGPHHGTALFKTVTKATISTFPSFDVSIGVQINGNLTIAHTAHGRAVGDIVTFSGATAGGGIDAAVINTSHTVVTVATDSYTIKVLDTVTGTGAIGGSSVVEKFIGLLDYPDIEQLFMYNHSGGNSLIATTSVPTASGGSVTKKIYVLASPFTDFVDRTGVTVTGGNDWQFVNFNDKVVGARAGNTMIVATTGNFAAVSAAVKDFTVGTSSVNIANNSITVAYHGYITGDMVTYEDSSGTVLAGLADGTSYYVIRVDANTLKLASTNANANTGTEIDLTGTGNNAQKLKDVTAAGTVPTGNCVHSAFGRLWAQKSHSGADQNVVAYCALLDETRWFSGAGEINVLGTAGAVAHGFDTLTAISSFDRFLVVFLRDSIIIYNSPDAPYSLGIEQIIQGVGCIARDSIQRIGNDLYFLSATGIRSLKQVIFSTDKVELAEVSKLVRRELVADMTSGDASIIKSNYDLEEGQYWLKAPSGNIWVADMYTLDEKTPVRITKFVNTDWYSFAYDEQETYIGAKGGIGSYSGFQDTLPNSAVATNYICDWESIYADFDNSRTKILKKVGVAVEGASGQQITLKWATDFSGKTGSKQLTIPGAGTLAEWGTSEWNIAEWGGGLSLARLKTSASKEGRVWSIGFKIESTGSGICVEQLSLFMKLGREDR